MFPRWTMVAICVAACAFPASTAAAQSGPDDCQGVTECRERALRAKDEGDFRRFHDLAWKAARAGPPNDPALMALLARAQVLSGRPHDALVMVRRLAERGVAIDADTDDDFARTRALPGWPEVAAILARVRASTTVPAAPTARDAASPAAAPPPPTPPPPAARSGNPSAAPSRRAAATPLAPAAGAAAAAAPADAAAPAGVTAAAPADRTAPADAAAPTLAAAPAPAAADAGSTKANVAAIPLRPLPAEEAARFSAGRFTTGGLAYDTVSQRFVVGDAEDRKLVVVGVGSAQAVDLVRADSAGFEDVAALDVDERRGDLWVAGGTTREAGGALHRLQLVSGRPLRTYRTAASAGRVHLVDLGITPSGTVVVLDAAQGALLILARGASELTLAMTLELETPAALAATDDEGVFFVAHADGIARVDLRSQTTAPVTSPARFDLTRFSRLRAHRNALVGVQTTADGLHQVVRLTLNGAGRRVTDAAVVDAPGTPAARPLIAVSGDDLYTIVGSAGPREPGVTLTVRRLHLR